VDVDIHADVPLAAGYAERQMGALGTDALERLHHGLIARQRPAELVFDSLGNSLDLSCFRPMKASVTDQAVDPSDSESPDRPRPARHGEEPPGGDQAHLVSGADRENAGDNLLEYRAVTFFREREHRGLGQRPHCAADPADDEAGVERTERTLLRLIYSHSDVRLPPTLAY